MVHFRVKPVRETNSGHKCFVTVTPTAGLYISFLSLLMYCVHDVIDAYILLYKSVGMDELKIGMCYRKCELYYRNEMTQI
jgi:hypothetical protein